MLPFRSKASAPSVLGVILYMMLAAVAWSQGTAAKPWAPPDPLALKDQEIRLLKQQLGQARQKLDSERVGRIVYETQLRVAALHGFDVKGVVSFTPLTAAIIDRLVAESFRSQYPGETLEHYVWLNQLFSALPQPYDMQQSVRDLMGEQAAGIYDPHSKQLYVKTDFPLESPMGQMVLAHEICHAFQDSNFSLLDLGAEDSENADRALAALSIAEGDATILMSEYFAKHGNPLDLFRFLPSMLSMDQEKLNAAPLAIQESLLFPYLDGMKFFQALRGRLPDGAKRTGAYPNAAWRKAVFLKPPQTTQQILHPELYLSQKMPAQIATPKMEGTAGKPTVNVAGEFGVRLLLAPMLGNERAAKAAEGWNGDKVAVADATQGNRRRVRWVTRWDSRQEADEFAAALEEALKARFAGKLEWQADAQGRIAETPEAHLRVTRPTAEGVALLGEVEKKYEFPKVELKARRNPLLGF